MNIPTPKYYFIALVLLSVLVIFSAYQFYSLYHHQKDFISVQEDRYNAYLLTTQLRRSSDELTRLVRTYAATGNPRFEEQFWSVLAIRNGELPLPEHYDRIYWDFLAVEGGAAPFADGKPNALQNMMQNAMFTEDELLQLKRSHAESDRLVTLENIAFNAMKGRFLDEQGAFTKVDTPNQMLAIEILHGDEYHSAKIAIMEPINEFYKKLALRTQTQVSQLAGYLNQTLSLQIIIFSLIVLSITWLIFVSRRYHLSMVNHLNQLVDERTSELSLSNQNLKQALDDIKTLEGIIPICSYCHNIRDDEGAWNKMEVYMAKHSDARFSHGVCPSCMVKVCDEHGLNEK